MRAGTCGSGKRGGEDEAKTKRWSAGGGGGKMCAGACRSGRHSGEDGGGMQDAHGALHWRFRRQRHRRQL
eukprot:165973-Chlamydomonas_euryale.AAC.1